MMKNYQVALFGLGRAGQFHLNSIRALPELRLRHAVDVNGELAERVAGEFGAQPSTSVEAALNDRDVDFVIVATPTQTHHDCIVGALNAGKAVFTEKPLGVTLDEVDACFELAAAKDLPLFVGFMRRFDPTFASLAHQVHGGAIGQLQLIRTTSRDSPLPTIDYIRTSHGIFHDCIVHDLDMIRFIAQEDPVEVFAIGSNFVPEIEAVPDLDNVLVSLKFKSGLLGSIDVNRFSAYGYDQRIEVFGGKGMVQADNRSPMSTVVATQGGLIRPPIHHSFPARYREAYRIELETFVDSLRHGNPVPVTHQDVRMNYLLAEGAERSYREGRPVTIAEFFEEKDES